MTKEQTVVEHLTEFRWRLMVVLATFFLVFTGALFFVDKLYLFLTGNLQQKLVVLGPNDILWIYISLASLTAFSLTLPMTVYQVWAYIRPALIKEEVGNLFYYIPATFLCFLAGLAFGFYFVTPAILQVLMGIGQDLFVSQLTAENYLAFVYHTTLPIALLFELPVIVAFLTSIGLLSPQFLVKYRRYAYFALLVIAVVITPADFISDLTMTIPLVFIYELSLVISRIIYKKKGRG